MIYNKKRCLFENEDDDFAEISGAFGDDVIQDADDSFYEISSSETDETDFKDHNKVIVPKVQEPTITHYATVEEFMSDFSAQNGQYVMMGYLSEAKLSQKRRYVNFDNDAKLRDMIQKYSGSDFSVDFDRLRNSQEYKDFINGQVKKATFDFTFANPIHIMRVCHYNFRWRNNMAYDDRHMQKKQEEYDLRRRMGFVDNKMAIPDDMEENDWRRKEKYHGPYITWDTDPDDKRMADRYEKVINTMKRNGIDKDDITDFFRNKESDEICLRQILRADNLENYDLYYVRERGVGNENGGQLEKFGWDVYDLLTTGYSNPNQKKKVDDAIEEIIEDEKIYKEEMEKISKNYQYRDLFCRRMMYCIGMIYGESEHIKYKPFVRINDKLLQQAYPWIDPKSLDELIDHYIFESFDDIQRFDRNSGIWL